MNGYVSGFLLFVVGIIFGLLIFTVLARLILQLVRADFHNPVSQFIFRFTNPMLLPLRRLIPGLFGIDMAAVLLLLVLQGLEIVITHLIMGMGLHSPLLFLSELVGRIIQNIAQLFFVCIIISVAISWINPRAAFHPVGRLLLQIIEPIMRPARRILPPIGGIDLSPILIFLAIGLLKILVVAPVTDLGRGLL